MRITLDPGHGGSDPGAAGGVIEKNITLPTTLQLGKYFSFLGIDVTYTRTTDTDVSLDDRAAIANNAGCDYFISVHSNAGGGTGIETYAYAAGGKGEQLAQKVQAQLIAYTGMRDRGVKFANFAVLRETVMPAILIENGFVDTSDADIIKTEEHKRKFCQAVTKAFCAQVGIAWKDMYAPAPTPIPTPTSAVENAILAYGPDDMVTARRLAEYLGNCAIFYRKADGSASPDVKVAKTLYIVGGTSVGHPNEKILSGANFFRTADNVSKVLGQ